MAFIVSPKVRAKLSIKHGISIDQVYECFANRQGDFLEDTREDHKSDPPTLWFVAETDFGIKLKIVFIKKDSDIILKTAYAANDTEIAIYSRKAAWK